MAGTTQLSDATVAVNNNPVEIIPNSLKFSEGLGEQKARAVSGGGGVVNQIFSNDIETNVGKVSFKVPATIDNIEAIRAWKINRNANGVTVTGSNVDGTITRTFSRAALLNDYEVELGSETDITVEFSSSPAV